MRDLSVAYLISAHTDPPQLLRLIEALQSEAEFFVHIDLKSDLSSFTRIITSERVHFIEERVDVRWGTMVEVRYQLNLLQAAVSYPVHFTHIFFLSGMDYPLWSPARIDSYLRANPHREFLQGLCMDTPYIKGVQRDNYTLARPFAGCPKCSILCRKLLKAVGYRKPLHFTVGGETWKLYKGSAWWCISEGLATYILKTCKEKSEVFRYFKDSFCPAETLIQTIAFNSPEWAPRCILSEGEYPGLAALTPLHYIYYEPVIRVLDKTDYEALRQSGRMFCRKVVSGRSDELVAMLPFPDA